MLAGTCLCKAVRFTVPDEFEYSVNCHCSCCRRATGSAFKPIAGIRRDRFNIAEGKDQLLVFGDEDAHDARCRTCGSLLYSVVRAGQYVHVTLGALTDSPTIRPTAHIYVGSKAPWFAITDDLPQFDELPVSRKGTR